MPTNLSKLHQLYLSKGLSLNHKDESDILWSNYFTNETPMGSLLVKNDLEDSVRAGNDIHLLHITSNIEEIIKSKKLFLSGGGLGACVYATPIHSDGSPHNLATFILNEELPNFLRAKGLSGGHSPVSLIAIKVSQTTASQKESALQKRNYLEFGYEYLECFNSLRAMETISAEDSSVYLDALEAQFASLSNFLKEFPCSLKEVSFETFLNFFEKNIPSIENLLNCYFETVLEYVYLHQDSASALKHQARGELYNEECKKMIFALVPALYQGFSTRKFKVGPRAITEYLQEHQLELISNFNSEHFYAFLRLRLFHYIYFAFLEATPIQEKRYLAEDVMRFYPNLAGQLLYKLMQGKTHLIESAFANKTTLPGGEWVLSTYKNPPKGEVGLRLSPNEMREGAVEFYSATIDSNNKVVFGSKLDITIAKELIDPERRIMRNPDHPA
ncbi:MAG: hypothetical protein WCK42_05395 [Myxococcaceae bacterium]